MLHDASVCLILYLEHLGVVYIMQLRCFCCDTWVYVLHSCRFSGKKAVETFKDRLITEEDRIRFEGLFTLLPVKNIKKS